jgi:hypothetical protein
MRYKVKFSGFAYVEADNKDEAEECFDDDDFSYKETSVDSIEEVDDFVVDW